MAKCIIELERIYGIRQGSAGRRSLEGDNLPLKTQEGLAKQINIDKRQLQGYKIWATRNRI